MALTVSEALLVATVHRAVWRPIEGLVTAQHEREVPDPDNVNDDLLVRDLDRQVRTQVVKTCDLQAAITSKVSSSQGRR